MIWLGYIGYATEVVEEQAQVITVLLCSGNEVALEVYEGYKRKPSVKKCHAQVWSRVSTVQLVPGGVRMCGFNSKQ